MLTGAEISSTTLSAILSKIQYTSLLHNILSTFTGALIAFLGTILTIKNIERNHYKQLLHNSMIEELRILEDGFNKFQKEFPDSLADATYDITLASDIFAFYPKEILESISELIKLRGTIGTPANKENVEAVRSKLLKILVEMKKYINKRRSEIPNRVYNNKFGIQKDQKQ